MPAPLVSVIIPTRNRRNLVSRAVASVRAQTHPEIETIIVDDGSDDGTAEDWLKAPEIRYLRLDKSVGGAAARNRGIAVARGEFIAFLDSDDEWLPEKIERQLPLLLDSPEVAAVYCRYLATDDQTGMTRAADGDVYVGDITEQLLSGRCPHSVSLFVVRSSALVDVGGFDEDLRGFQDTDLWMRLASTWEFDAVDEPLAILHDHAGARVTTDIEARTAALDGFLDKWGEAMSARIGIAGVSEYRRRNLAVAHGSLVLTLVREGRRGDALRELRRYLDVAGTSNPRQATGLMVAVVAGPEIHDRIKAGRQRRQNK